MRTGAHHRLGKIDAGEVGLPGAAVQPIARRMHFVEFRRERRGEETELVLHRFERLAPEGEQRAQFATAQLRFGQRQGRPVADLVSDLGARGLGGVGPGGDGGALRALHQGLAVADEDGHHPFVVDHRLDVYALGEFGERLVALVEQVVGRSAVAHAERARDLLVEPGDLLAVLGDVLGGEGDVLLHAGVDLIELAGKKLEAVDQHLALRQHRLARGNIGGVVRHFLYRIEELRHGRREARVGVGNEVVDGRDEIAVVLVVARLALRLQQLLVQELVVGALHVHHPRALAHVAIAHVLGRLGGLHRALAAVAGGVGIGDVVAGDVELGLRGHQPGQTDVEEIGHDALPA